MSAASEHEHTGFCRGSSRYVLVEVRVMVEVGGECNAHVRMKPGGACWSDIEPVAHFRTQRDPGLPQSAEQAALLAESILAEAFPLDVA